MKHPTRTMTRISVFVNTDTVSGINPLAALHEAGVATFDLTASRAAVLRNNHPLVAAFSQAQSLVDIPAETMSFLVATDQSGSALNNVAATLGLDTPGAGSIFAETVQLVEDPWHDPDAFSPKTAQRNVSILTELTGICCIAQRGEGERLARVALDTGTAVPLISFGQGTGVRDKLGLLRITVPADKEIVTFAASRYDADSVMAMMIDSGRLDLPGRGFIYRFPLEAGLINMKVCLGHPRYAASMEQIIGAVDELKGGIGWRTSGRASGGSARKSLRDMIEIRLSCNEGFSEGLIAAAMGAGAAGATIGYSRHVDASEKSCFSPAREECSMIVPEQTLDTIITALAQGGAFETAAHGRIVLREVPMAFTYLGK